MKRKVALGALLLCWSAGAAMGQTRIDMRRGVFGVQRQVTRDLVIQTWNRSVERPISHHGVARALRNAHFTEGLARITRELPLTGVSAMILGEDAQREFVPRAVIFSWTDTRGNVRELAFADLALKLPVEDSYKGLGELAQRRSGYEVVNRNRDDQCDVRRVRAGELFAILNAAQLAEEVDPPPAEEDDTARLPDPPGGSDGPGDGGNDGSAGDPPEPVIVPLPTGVWTGLLGLTGVALRESIRRRRLRS